MSIGFIKEKRESFLPRFQILQNALAQSAEIGIVAVVIQIAVGRERIDETALPRRRTLETNRIERVALTVVIDVAGHTSSGGNIRVGDSRDRRAIGLQRAIGGILVVQQITADSAVGEFLLRNLVLRQRLRIATDAQLADLLIGQICDIGERGQTERKAAKTARSMRRVTLDGEIIGIYAPIPRLVVDINPSISLETQKISTKAKEILAMIYCYYWCSEEELDHLNEELKNEVQNTSQELFGNVNTDLLFEEAKQRQKNSLEQSGMANSLSERKAPWYKRLFGFIKK